MYEDEFSKMEENFSSVEATSYSCIEIEFWLS